MVEITSRQELQKWLKDKPDECAQVIAARAALRVLPYPFQHHIAQDWVAKFALVLFRANAIAWAARNFPAHDMGRAAARAARVAYGAANAAHTAAAHTAAACAAAAYAAAAHTAAARAAAAYAAARADTVYAATNAAYAAHAGADAGADAAMWNNVSADADWLSREGDPVLAANRLTVELLWLRDPPEGLQEVWDNAAARLTALDPSYGVWIDWYNRRIKGADASFDIPDDKDRVEDKAILIKLADATNKDFWDKGATHVNTTLQSWIDEARARAVEPDEPEPQNQDVVVFYPDGRGQFDANSAVGVNELLTSQEARERYAEACDTASEVLSLCIGHNQVGFIVPMLERYVGALGNRPEDCQTGNIIQRGERALSAAADAIAELTLASPDEPVPIRTKQILSALHALPKAYYALVNFDPALARRIPLLLELGQTQVSISPEQYRSFVKNALTTGILTETAENLLIEAGEAIAGSDEANVPSTYRYLEIARNFPRAMVAFLWKHKSVIGKATAAGVAGLVSAGVVFVANQAALLQFFAGSPNMTWFLEQLSALLKMAP